MNIVVMSPDQALGDVIAFASRRRGHQSIAFDRPEALNGNLPFAPTVVVLAFGEAERQHVVTTQKVAEKFPDAGVFVVFEKPTEPFPALVLQAGADQVMSAPVNPTELVLRAESWGSSRAPAQQAADVLRLADLEIALEQYTARKNGILLPLTRLELRLLFCLCQHHPHVAPLERMLTFGWDTIGDPDAALIKTHISHIRRKLALAGGEPFEIASRQAVGYTLRLAGDN